MRWVKERATPFIGQFEQLKHLYFQQIEVDVGETQHLQHNRPVHEKCSVEIVPSTLIYWSDKFPKNENQSESSSQAHQHKQWSFSAPVNARAMDEIPQRNLWTHNQLRRRRWTF